MTSLKFPYSLSFSEHYRYRQVLSISLLVCKFLTLLLLELIKIIYCVNNFYVWNRFLAFLA